MDYTTILISLVGSGNILLLSLVLLFAIFGAISGIRGEMMKFFILIAIVGLSFLATPFVATVAVIVFCFYYGKKIYKGVYRQ